MFRCLGLAEHTSASHNGAGFTPYIPPREAEDHMPSLFKFLFAAGMAVGLVAGGLLFLSEYAEPGQKEVRSVVSGLKVRR